MKSKFRFPYVCKNIDFESKQEIKFKTIGKITPRKDQDEINIKEIDMLIIIEIQPSENKDMNRFPDGDIYITLPGEPDECYILAKKIAHDLAQHLEFFYEEFKIAGGLEIAEKIPENEEEAKKIGEEKYWAEVSLEEVPTPVKFDRRILSLFPPIQNFLRIIHQYNHANKSDNSIDYYLGMFKVLETQFYSGRNKVRDTLINNNEFCSLIIDTIKLKRESGESTPVLREELPEVINSLVRLRDNCAHLREKNEFGFAPYDPQVYEEVTPFCQMVEILARESIMLKFKEGNERLFDEIFKV